MKVLKSIPLVAIIDDDAVHRFVVETLMNKCLFAQKILHFSSGNKALAFFSAHQDAAHQLPDVIILDIEMPVMNAWEFLDEFKRINDKFSKKIPIYILSTSIYSQDKQKAASYPEVFGYIVKPLKKEDLIRIAEEATAIYKSFH